MNSELFDALNLLEKERGIPVDFMVDKITKAIITACKNSYGNEDARVEVNAEKGAFRFYLRKTVVDDVYEPGKEISLEKAREISPLVNYEDKVEVQLNTKEFGRIAARNCPKYYPSRHPERRAGADDAGIPKQASGVGQCVGRAN